MQSSGLTWVLSDGRPTHVSRFAGLRPASRPPVTCPQCGRRLTLKLGRVLRHHAAHPPRDRCAATRPETALHLDAKFHVAAQLESASGSELPLFIEGRCAGAGTERCDVARRHEWTRGWDEVCVEARVSTARPDIVLRRAGADVAAIEILVSHAVEDAKATALQVSGVPWIEVRADVALPAGDAQHDAAWHLDKPLAVVREGDGIAWGAWRCPRHEHEHQVLVDAAAAARAAEAEASRYRTVLLGARVVDIYHPGGARDRVIYRVEDEYLDGTPCVLVLRNGNVPVTIQSVIDPDTSRLRARERVRERYIEDIARLAGANGFSDSPMGWASGDAAANLVHEAMSDVVPGDPTPLATRYPRRWFYDRARARWFLPPEMRGVRWDRPESDVFAAHPAWAAGRAAVRERAAPASQWSSFVFASRPTIDAFGRDVRVTRPATAESAKTRAASAPIAILSSRAALVATRVVVLLTRAADEDDVRAVASSLHAADVAHVWVSHPMDWTSARADLAWAPAGRDGRGCGVVVVDGVGVYRGEHFVRVFARGDRHVSPQAIQERSAERVAGLRGQP